MPETIGQDPILAQSFQQQYIDPQVAHMQANQARTEAILAQQLAEPPLGYQQVAPPGAGDGNGNPVGGILDWIQSRLGGNRPGHNLGINPGGDNPQTPQQGQQQAQVPTGYGMGNYGTNVTPYIQQQYPPGNIGQNGGLYYGFNY